MPCYQSKKQCYSISFIILHYQKGEENKIKDDGIQGSINSIATEMGDGSDSSDDDIIIHSTREIQSDPANLQSSEDSHMDVDIAQHNDDRKCPTFVYPKVINGKLS